jgi:hypothetical protein
MTNALLISSTPNSAASVTISFEPRGNSAGAAATPASTAFQSRVSSKAMHLDCAETNTSADKRWIGSSVCLATAVASALLLMWLTLHFAG